MGFLGNAVYSSVWGVFPARDLPKSLLDRLEKGTTIEHVKGAVCECCGAEQDDEFVRHYTDDAKQAMAELDEICRKLYEGDG